MQKRLVKVLAWLTLGQVLCVFALVALIHHWVTREFAWWHNLALGIVIADLVVLLYSNLDVAAERLKDELFK